MSSSGSDKMQTAISLPTDLFSLNIDGTYDIMKTIRYCIRLACFTKVDELEAINKDLYERRLTINRSRTKVDLVEAITDVLCNFHRHESSDLSLAPILQTQSLEALNQIAQTIKTWARNNQLFMLNDGLTKVCAEPTATNVSNLIKQILAMIKELTRQYFRKTIVKQDKFDEFCEGASDIDKDETYSQPTKKKRKVREDPSDPIIQTDAQQQPSVNANTVPPLPQQTFQPPQFVPPTQHNTSQRNIFEPYQQLGFLRQQSAHMDAKFLNEFFNDQEQRVNMYKSSTNMQEVVAKEQQYNNFLHTRKVAYFNDAQKNYLDQIHQLRLLIEEAQRKAEHCRNELSKLNGN